VPFNWTQVPLSENPALSSPPKNEPSRKEMHLKIPLLSQSLKLSKSKPGCIVLALHFFVKWIPQMAY
jgi:hypothetical protein